jgi:hypothetical protein
MNISTMKRNFSCCACSHCPGSCAKESLETGRLTAKGTGERRNKQQRAWSGLVQFSDELIAKIEDDLDAGKLATRSMDEPGDGRTGNNINEEAFPYAGEYEPRTRAEGLHDAT